MSHPHPHPHPHTVLFARGTLARLALWPALRLAVHASWGGPSSAEKQRWLAGVLVDQFEAFLVASAPPSWLSPASTTSAPNDAPTTANATTTASSPPDAPYIEDLLLQIMADEFDAVLEDDSAAPVAADIVCIYRAACVGDDAFVRELEAQVDRVKGSAPRYARGVDSENESGSEWEDEDEEEEEGEGEQAPQLLDHPEPQTREVDEDGFTLVKKKGRR